MIRISSIVVFLLLFEPFVNVESGWSEDVYVSGAAVGHEEC
jgi:hypothetical protein